MENNNTEMGAMRENESSRHDNALNAIRNIKRLHGRDITYQHEIIEQYRDNAKDLVNAVKKKIESIRRTREFCELWLTDYRENDREKENLSYLSIETITAYRPLAKKYGIFMYDDFYTKYKNANGDYKALRVSKTPKQEGYDPNTWDRRRNDRLQSIINNIQSNKIGLYVSESNELKGLPSREHTCCIVLGYSPEPEKIESMIPKVLLQFDLLEEDNWAIVKQERRSVEKSSADIDDLILKEAECEVCLYECSALKKRDITYQFELVDRCYGSSEKNLNDVKYKLINVEEAIEVYDKWLNDYIVDNKESTNLNYLSIEIIDAFRPLAIMYGLFMYQDFYDKYKDAGGDYKKLRVIKTQMDCWGTDTWDVLRNEWLESIIKNIREKNIAWYEKQEGSNREGLPSREHTRCILLGYSPDPEKLRILIPGFLKLRSLENNANETRKRGTKRVACELSLNGESSSVRETVRKIRREPKTTNENNNTSFEDRAKHRTN